MIKKEKLIEENKQIEEYITYLTEEEIACIECEDEFERASRDSETGCR